MTFTSQQYALAAGIALCLAITALFAFTNAPQSASQPASAAQALPYAPDTRRVESGQRHYENSRYRFALLYPDDLRVLEYDEGGGATTITFENPGDGRGFQVYVAPYDGAEIPRDLIERDTGSGAMKDQTVTAVASVSAITFSSTNPTMGDIREVWFVRDGYRYQVVTYQPFAAWLSGILQSWQFI